MCRFTPLCIKLSLSLSLSLSHFSLISLSFRFLYRSLSLSISLFSLSIFLSLPISLPSGSGKALGPRARLFKHNDPSTWLRVSNAIGSDAYGKGYEEAGNNGALEAERPQHVFYYNVATGVSQWERPCFSLGQLVAPETLTEQGVEDNPYAWVAMDLQPGDNASDTDEDGAEGNEEEEANSPLLRGTAQSYAYKATKAAKQKRPPRPRTYYYNTTTKRSSWTAPRFSSNWAVQSNSSGWYFWRPRGTAPWPLNSRRKACIGVEWLDLFLRRRRRRRRRLGQGTSCLHAWLSVRIFAEMFFADPPLPFPRPRWTRRRARQWRLGRCTCATAAAASCPCLARTPFAAPRAPRALGKPRPPLRSPPPQPPHTRR